MVEGKPNRIRKLAGEIIGLKKTINRNTVVQSTKGFREFLTHFLSKGNMKVIILIIFLSCQFVRAQMPNQDLPALLDQLSKIGTNRWNVSLSADNEIGLASKEKALGEMPGDNYGPGEGEYDLYFSFKVVAPFNAKDADQARTELKKLRMQGNKIEHTSGMGRYAYFPKNEDEWALVIKIRQAERRVYDIPRYRFKTVYLSVENSEDYFVPNQTNAKALRYKADIENFFKLLEKAGS